MTRAARPPSRRCRRRDRPARASTAIIGPFADTHHVEDQRDDTHSPSAPGLAMANGRVYTAWIQDFRHVEGPVAMPSEWDAVVYRTKENGAWSPEVELPGSGPLSGEYGTAQKRSVSVVVDGAGAQLAVGAFDPEGAENVTAARASATIRR